ncbi:MAG: lipid-A-disaccharide synthase [Planctomycetota bacterium]|nr:MAG: lipid-A-disaccharide synthase [Planctomycetota bacterium]
MHFFFSAGEPSGDQHAAFLMRAIQVRCPGARFSGFGGQHLKEAGAEILFPLTDLAVIGFTAVLPLLKKFYDVAHQGRTFLNEQKPDAVILVDFPGFNWHIAKYARQAGIPVYYYCPPQLWAWASWRIRKIRKYVDCVLSVLPFEAEWYRQRNVPVEYVGHPFFDEAAARQLDTAYGEELRRSGSPVVGLLPGSRGNEVTRNFPLMVEVVRRLHPKYPTVRFPVACYKPVQRDFCATHLQKVGAGLPIDLYLDRTPEIIAASDFCLMVSGSVSLELLARGKPALVMYCVSWLNYLIGKMLVHIRWMSLPNLIVNREMMPEFLCVGKHPQLQIDRMTEQAEQWLSNPQQLAKATEEMQALRQEVVEVGGVATAAQTILRLVAQASHRP